MSLPLPGAESRIGITANRAVTGILFGFAIISYITRAYIRARILKQFHIEDALLAFAVLLLIGSTVIGYITVPDQYRALRLQAILHDTGSGTDHTFEILQEFNHVDRDIAAAKMENGVTTVWFFLLFAVKLSYLCFFRRLIYRVQSLNIWWWCVTAFTIPAGLACIAAAWLTCPYFSLNGILSCVGPETTFRALRDTAITTAMDITTDLLVLSFPLALLWRVRISLRQKFGLGCVLSLSLFMIVIAVIRMAGIQQASGVVDIVWLAFWQQQECSIAVIMVSVSAFRSFFAQKSLSYSAQRRRPEDYPPTIGRKIWRRERSAEEDLEKTLGSTTGMPSLPSSTFQGVHTMIRDMRLSRIWVGGSGIGSGSGSGMEGDGTRLTAEMDETQVDERGEAMELGALKEEGRREEMILKEVHIEQVVEYLPRKPEQRV